MSSDLFCTKHTSHSHWPVAGLNLANKLSVFGVDVVLTAVSESRTKFKTKTLIIVINVLFSVISSVTK